jgi:hypothetical protein
MTAADIQSLHLWPLTNHLNTQTATRRRRAGDWIVTARILAIKTIYSMAMMCTMRMMLRASDRAASLAREA